MNEIIIEIVCLVLYRECVVIIIIIEIEIYKVIVEDKGKIMCVN